MDSGFQGGWPQLSQKLPQGTYPISLRYNLQGRDKTGTLIVTGMSLISPLDSWISAWGIKIKSHSLMIAPELQRKAI